MTFWNEFEKLPLKLFGIGLKKASEVARVSYWMPFLLLLKLHSRAKTLYNLRTKYAIEERDGLDFWRPLALTNLNLVYWDFSFHFYSSEDKAAATLRTASY